MPITDSLSSAIRRFSRSLPLVACSSLGNILAEDVEHPRRSQQLRTEIGFQDPSQRDQALLLAQGNFLALLGGIERQHGAEDEQKRRKRIPRPRHFLSLV